MFKNIYLFWTPFFVKHGHGFEQQIKKTWMKITEHGKDIWDIWPHLGAHT